jgi:hypothetical protein
VDTCGSICIVSFIALGVIGEFDEYALVGFELCEAIAFAYAGE